MKAVTHLDAAKNDAPASPSVRPLPPDAPEPGIIETPTHRKVYQVCAFAHIGRLALLFGGAGVGKTTGEQCYVSDHRESAYYVNLHGVKSTAAMLQTIAEGVRAGYFGAYRNISLMRELARYLGPGSLLVLDECQSLSREALDCVRFFIDDQGVGLVLAGNELVYSTIAGKNRRAFFAQVQSRVDMRLHLPHPTEADADAVLSAWGVADRAGRDYGRQLALGSLGLRHLVRILREARAVANSKGRAIDHRLMHATVQMLGLTE